MSIPVAGNRQAQAIETRLRQIQDHLDNLRDHLREGVPVPVSGDVFASLKAEKSQLAAELRALEKPKPTDIKA